MREPSEMDKEFYAMARDHINDFIGKHYPHPFAKVLEIGPDRPLHPPGVGWGWDTLDIKPGCTYQLDITQVSHDALPKEQYDVVLLMEVLEHTMHPFVAIGNIRWWLKDGGLLLASAPWNFRCHGPVPDFWRFNQNSWRLMLRNWDILEMDVLETPGRPLMPLHINVLARCNKSKNVDARTMKWEPIP